jgi:hypothetical protein
VASTTSTARLNNNNMKNFIAILAILSILVGGCKTIDVAPQSAQSKSIKAGLYYIVTTDPAEWHLDLDPESVSDVSGSVHILPTNTQRLPWHIAPSSLMSGTYVIFSDGKYIQPEKTGYPQIGAGGDITANFREIHWYPKTDDAFQAWKFEPADSSGKIFRIRNVGTDLVMESGTQFSQWVYQTSITSNTRQLWRLEKIKADSQ